MQRHMQNISFLVIVGVLLSCAFFFSEQVRVGDDPQRETSTAIPTLETREDLPDCAALPETDARLTCYQDSAALSQRLLDSVSDRILAAESDSARRLDFVEMQQAWETSRDADCQFIVGSKSVAQAGDLSREMCLVERNLARLDQLEAYFCDTAEDASCEPSAQTLP